VSHAAVPLLLPLPLAVVLSTAVLLPTAVLLLLELAAAAAASGCTVTKPMHTATELSQPHDLLACLLATAQGGDAAALPPTAALLLLRPVLAATAAAACAVSMPRHRATEACDLLVCLRIPAGTAEAAAAEADAPCCVRVLGGSGGSCRSCLQDDGGAVFSMRLPWGLHDKCMVHMACQHWVREVINTCLGCAMQHGNTWRLPINCMSHKFSEMRPRYGTGTVQVSESQGPTSLHMMVLALHACAFAIACCPEPVTETWLLGPDRGGLWCQ
jgi:hypothetical protein